jgi:hypothetical protein
MNPLGSHRRADELARALDGHDSADPSVRPLVAVADRVRAAATDPSPEFRLALRERLMVAAETELVPARRSPAHDSGPAPVRRARPARPSLGDRLRRRLSVVAAAAVVAGAGVSVVAISAQSLPGDALYPVKRAGEDVQLLVRTDPATEGRLQLEHARTRLEEVDELTRRGDAGSADTTVLVSATLQDFTEQAEDGAGSLIEAFDADREPATIDEVNGFTVDAAARLERLSTVVPVGSGEDFADAAGTVISLAERTAGACRSCPVVDTQPLGTLRASVQDLLDEVDRELTLGGSAPQLPGGDGPIELPELPSLGPRGPGNGNGGGGGDDGDGRGDDGTTRPDARTDDQAPGDRTDETPSGDEPPGGRDPQRPERPGDELPDRPDEEPPGTPELPTRNLPVLPDLPGILRDLLGGDGNSGDGSDDGSGDGGDDPGTDEGGPLDGLGDLLS